MAAVLGLVLATHPVPAVAVTLLTGGLTAGLGAAPGDAALATLAMAAAQASVGWSNDALDAARDATAGRTEKPIVRGLVTRRTVAVGAIVAAAASLLTAWPLGAGPAGLLLMALASAWLYNLGLKATLLSWVPYAVSFGLLAVFAWSVAGRAIPWWVVAGAAVVAVAAHLMNVLPDLEGDTGMRGLPHRLGPRRSVLLAAVLLAAALGGAFVLGRGWEDPAVLAAALAGGALATAAAVVAGRDRTRAAFHLTIGAAAATAAAVVAIVAPRG